MNTLEELDYGRMPGDVSSALGDRYTSVEYVSSGATSSVFSAHDTILDRRVAIKVLKHAGEKELISFQQEARAAAKLDHANLVSILDFGKTEKNHAYLIMGFVEGRSLESIVAEHGRLPLDRALKLLLQICNGLAHAHNKRISHRDLKTSNIMVQDYDSDSPVAIVVDFGLAKEHQEQEESRVAMGGAIGSPLYMSPEQASGKHGDERSDIYGLACIAYRLIAGCTPFQSDDLFDLLKQHIEDVPPRLSELEPALDLPPGLESYLLRMLEKWPAGRIQKIEEVRAFFAGILRDITTVAAAGSATPDQIEGNRKSSIVSFVKHPGFLASAVIAATGVFVALFLNWETLASRPATVAATPAKSELKSVSALFQTSTDRAFFDMCGKPYLIPIDATGIRDDDLACLGKGELPVNAVSLAGTGITGEGLHFLNRKEIAVLDLSGTEISEEGYRQLFELQHLERLALDKVDVTDGEIELIARLPKLKNLSLHGCEKITNKALQHLSDYASKLESLDLSETPISDSGIKRLQKCSELTALRLNNSACTDEAIVPLLSLPNLSEFEFERSAGIHDVTVQRLANRFGKQLKHLGLADTNVTRACLQYLANCPKLSYLTLSNVPLEAADIELLGTFSGLDTLVITKLNCPDLTIRKNMLKLKRLHTLTILSSNISDETEQKIRDSLEGVSLLTGRQSAGINGLRPGVRETVDLFLDSGKD